MPAVIALWVAWRRVLEHIIARAHSTITSTFLPQSVSHRFPDLLLQQPNLRHFALTSLVHFIPPPKRVKNRLGYRIGIIPVAYTGTGTECKWYFASEHRKIARLFVLEPQNICLDTALYVYVSTDLTRM
jgi:hypothetical protein